MADTLVRVELAWAQEGQVQTVLLDLPGGAATRLCYAGYGAFGRM